MSVLTLVWSYLKSKPLNTALNIMLLSLGIAVITLLLLFNNQLQQKITQNARGIDLVVGAKGSPLQLILCTIFHIDYPTGNIHLAEAEKIVRNRMVKKAIPLALGDSYEGFRIIGTTRDYASLYNAELRTGEWWAEDFEATVGASVAERTNLKTGDAFVSSHGLTQGITHAEQKFLVKGILKRTYTVLDNLVLTNIESIWKVHEEHSNGEATAKHLMIPDSSFVSSPLVPSIVAGDSTKEITAMLIQYRSPMGAVQLPRLVNSQSTMQAASPAFETARLFSILGVAVTIITGFAYVLLFISALSIFIALYNSLKERRYDLAIMRSMGATRKKLFITVLLEGSMLTLTGSVIGMLAGHGIIVLLSTLIADLNTTGISGFIFYPAELGILGGSLLLGMVCSLIPAIQAYRTDISQVLGGK